MAKCWFMALLFGMFFAFAVRMLAVFAVLLSDTTNMSLVGLEQFFLNMVLLMWFVVTAIVLTKLRKTVIIGMGGFTFLWLPIVAGWGALRLTGYDLFTYGQYISSAFLCYQLLVSHERRGQGRVSG